MVAITGFIAEGLSSPACFQSFTYTSPTVAAGRTWLVTARMIRSGRSRWWAAL